MLALAALVATSLLAGCESPLACTASVEPALVVRVEDSLDASPQAEGATAIATEGAFSEALTPFGHNDAGELVGLAGPLERAGTYTVTVDKAGFRQWRQAGVRVTADACHVRTVTLTARLQRAAGTVRVAP